MVFGFDSEVAKVYGVNEAIVIANFQFWVLKNKANGRHQYDGRYWTYNSAKAFGEVFPFWSEKQIRRVVDGLVERGVLIKGNYNQSAYDRTLWYAFAEEEKWIGSNGEIHFPKSGNGFPESGKPIPDSNTDNNTDNIMKEKNKNINVFIKEKKPYGEFKNVMLTDEEMKKLMAEYQVYLKDAIEILSRYLETGGGKKYKSHYAVMKRLGWVWDEVHKNPDCGYREGGVKCKPDPTKAGGLREETIEEYYERTMGWKFD